MSDAADAYRQRAEYMRRAYGHSNDQFLRELAAGIAQSYEALARNEEWLTGEMADTHADHCPFERFTAVVDGETFPLDHAFRVRTRDLRRLKPPRAPA